MEITKLPIAVIKPHENNPRRNEGAVDAVKASIEQCGYIAPIILDEDYVILAGHTRYAALKELHYTDVEVIVKEGLSEEQKKKYRILDNKTNEFASWDYEKLEEELNGLDFGDFDFGFGDTSKNLDDVDLDSFFEEAEPKEKEPKRIKCPHCGEWFDAE